MKLRRRRPQPTPIAEIKATYAGNWVSIKGGRVIAHGPTAKENLDNVVALGSAGRGCVIIYVPRPEEIKRWAVRFGDEQRIWPNSEFMTRDGAERWGLSCAEMHGTPTLMRLVEHDDRLRGTWEDVGPIHHLVKTTGGTDGVV